MYAVKTTQNKPRSRIQRPKQVSGSSAHAGRVCGTPKRKCHRQLGGLRSCSLPVMRMNVSSPHTGCSPPPGRTDHPSLLRTPRLESWLPGGLQSPKSRGSPTWLSMPRALPEALLQGAALLFWSDTGLPGSILAKVSPGTAGHVGFQTSSTDGTLRYPGSAVAVP